MGMIDGESDELIEKVHLTCARYESAAAPLVLLQHYFSEWGHGQATLAVTVSHRSFIPVACRL